MSASGGDEPAFGNHVDGETARTGAVFAIGTGGLVIAGEAAFALVSRVDRAAFLV